MFRPEVKDYHGSVPVRVRMAPSPTGFLHIGGVRTFLFNWLFARGRGGECLLRIENTDTSREVVEAVDQIERSLRWLGIDWDGPTRFQLERMERAGEEARRLVREGSAYEDDGAIRIRMPDDGVTSWDDAVKGRIEFPNEKLEDLVLVRSDGRPTYNFASPLDDWLDGITDVIRGDDHVSNTPKQIRVLNALGAELPVYAHLPNVLGTDGKKLSKRHGAVSVDEFREGGYLPETLVNFLALLGWSYDDKTTIMSREELVERFTLDRVGSSPTTFDYAKLDWMNGVYLRELPLSTYADRLVDFLGERGYAWPDQRIRAAAPLCQEKIARLGEFPAFAGFFFDRVEPPAELLAGAGEVLAAARARLALVQPFRAEQIEAALREVCEGLGLKPREAFQPLRIAVTGSKISPGLFESIELLGLEETLSRVDRALALAE
jgi:glutamyl-tRNA synthetase